MQSKKSILCFIICFIFIIIQGGCDLFNSEDNPTGPTHKHYSIASSYISDTVDNDNDGYYCTYNLNFDVDIVNGSDSVYVKLYYKTQETSDWIIFFTSVNFFVKGTSVNDKQWITIEGNGHQIVDLKIEIYSSTGKLERETILYGIKEESEEKDTQIYNIASMYISDGVDNDGDEYYSEYNLNFDIDISEGSDSIYVEIYYRVQGTANWINFFTSVNFLISGSIVNDEKWIAVEGGNHQIVDLKLETYNSADNMVADTAIYNIKEESSENDVDVFTDDYFPSSIGNIWNFSYRYSSYTSSNPPRTQTDSGTITWEITGKNINGDSIEIIIKKSDSLIRMTGSAYGEEYDSIFTPPIVTINTIILTGMNNGNGLSFGGDTCWYFVHDPEGEIPEDMLIISDTTVFFQGDSIDAVILNPSPCSSGSGGKLNVSGPRYFTTSANIGPVEYYEASPIGMTGSTYAKTWNLISTNFYP